MENSTRRPSAEEIRALINRIYTAGTVTDPTGKIHRFHSAIDRRYGERIAELIQEYRCERILEVGCAFGIASLFISIGLTSASNPRHVIIDAFQTKHWHGVGFKHLLDVGVTYCDFVEKLSELALPELLGNGEEFDFVLVDGWHTFDHTLVDLFYANRMLRVGGIVALDDIWMPGVRRAARYLLKYPCFEPLDAKQPIRRKMKRRLLDAAGRMICKLPLGRLRRDVFNDAFLVPDTDLGLDQGMAFLRKTSRDDRWYDWYAPF